MRHCLDRRTLTPQTYVRRFVEREFPQLYPKYLHILRVDPDKIDRVEKAAVWEEKPDDIRGMEQRTHSCSRAGVDGRDFPFHRAVVLTQKFPTFLVCQNQATASRMVIHQGTQATWLRRLMLCNEKSQTSSSLSRH